MPFSDINNTNNAPQVVENKEPVYRANPFGRQGPRVRISPPRYLSAISESRVKPKLSHLKKSFSNDRRKILKWTAPIIIGVTLPAHATTSEPPKADCVIKVLNAPVGAHIVLILNEGFASAEYLSTGEEEQSYIFSDGFVGDSLEVQVIDANDPNGEFPFVYDIYTIDEDCEMSLDFNFAKRK